MGAEEAEGQGRTHAQVGKELATGSAVVADALSHTMVTCGCFEMERPARW
jgi:hypothetical protein